MLMRVSLPRQEAVIFTCHLSSGDQTFTIDVDVNPTDGMDQDEAIRVNTKVFEKVSPSDKLGTPQSFKIRVCANEDGVWTVEFDVAYEKIRILKSDAVTRTHLIILAMRIKVAINPLDQTVIYR